ncbi:hypothetical protein [Alishewanella tabrizica]|uniref:Uncharacterized protein n=1 Tax=Alishewanella tabrizica TaxID=671278 RepID=A0ABQ2WNM3_9ALTE|nr:hypothetical protein [Alishewanella tabrizica]GGW62521.1 hypothetical protein GCM10008111_18110 [Alishewanella tabrizica]
MIKSLLFSVLTLLCTVAFTLLLGFWLFISQGTVEQPDFSSDDINDSRQFLSSTLSKLRNEDQTIELVINQADLNALSNVGSFSLDPLVFRGVIQNASVDINITYPLPAHFGDKLISLKCTWSVQTKAFVIEQCRIGKLTIPSFLTNFLFNSMVKLALDSPADNKLLQLIKQGVVQDKKLLFNGGELQNIDLNINALLHKTLTSQQSLLSESASVAPHLAFYLERLKQLTAKHPNERRLAFFMQNLLVDAIERSASSSLNEEYLSVVWALAAGFGNKNFAQYVSGGEKSITVPALPRVELAARRDLTLHFLYSAVIKSLGNIHIANQIGRLKEISDAGKGGSGFSFVDMAANKAGIHFVDQLSKINKNLVLTLDTDAFQAAFFPSISDLPEGLSESQLNEQFGGIRGDKIAELETLIEKRLAALALYQAL